MLGSSASFHTLIMYRLGTNFLFADSVLGFQQRLNFMYLCLVHIDHRMN